MTQPLFFKSAKGMTLAEIAALTGAHPADGVPLDRTITNIAPLDSAGASDLTFFDNPKSLDELAGTRAGACLLAPRFVNHAPPRLAVLTVREPYRAFVAIGRTLFPDSLRPSLVFAAAGIAPGAHVHPSARLESGVALDPGVVVGPGAEIGSGTVVAADAVVGPGVRIGRNCSIGPQSSILHVLIADPVLIHPGCRRYRDRLGRCAGGRGVGWLSGEAGEAVDAGGLSAGAIGVTPTGIRQVPSLPSWGGGDGRRTHRWRRGLKHMNDVGTSLETIDIAGILRAIPHRYPFLMVDRIIAIRGDDFAIGIKNVTEIGRAHV